MTSAAPTAPEALVAALVETQRHIAAERRPVRATWLNHYSLQIAMETAPDAVRAMDVCGVDGQLLRRLLRHPTRTSADLVVPLLLRRDPTVSTVMAIGGAGDRGEALSRRLSEYAGRPVSVHSVNGFQGLPRGPRLGMLVRQVQPDLVLVGLGAGLQEEVLLEAAQAMPRGYALTCGGFLDQALTANYYPAWAYPLRLNWLVRLAREPRRLWRRYSVDAVRAVARQQRWRASMAGVAGLWRHAEMCATGRPVAVGPADVLGSSLPPESVDRDDRMAV